MALRRLRSGLTLFRPLLPPEHNKALLEEARWLAAEVTRLRDLFLLSQDTLTPCAGGIAQQRSPRRIGRTGNGRNRARTHGFAGLA